MKDEIQSGQRYQVKMDSAHFDPAYGPMEWVPREPDASDLPVGALVALRNRPTCKGVVVRYCRINGMDCLCTIVRLRKPLAVDGRRLPDMAFESEILAPYHGMQVLEGGRPRRARAAR